MNSKNISILSNPMKHFCIGKIYFLREPNDVEVNIGSSVELKCKASVSSTEKVDIKWHKNGKELNISESRYTIQR